MAPAGQIPLTVIGGFLGAGKTTLINQLLQQTEGVRFAVLVNDFGDLAIDDALIASHDGKTIALANGCICCTIGDDLIESLMGLTTSDNPPDHILVEASGVADPRPIAELGSLDPHLARDLTVVVVDGEAFPEQAADDRLAETLSRQLDAADLLLLNKSDALDAARYQELTAELKKRNPEAPFAAMTPSMGFATLLSLADPGAAVDGADHIHHDQIFETQTLVLKDDLDLEGLLAALTSLPPDILRVKGFVEQDGLLLEVQMAGKRVSRKTVTSGADAPVNGLVVIGLAPLPSFPSLSPFLAEVGQ